MPEMPEERKLERKIWGKKANDELQKLYAKKRVGRIRDLEHAKTDGFPAEDFEEHQNQFLNEILENIQEPSILSDNTMVGNKTWIKF